MLPVVGEIRSIREGVEDFDGMTRAVEEGDWEEAARLGLFGVLGIAGGIPVLGKGFKAGRAALVRGLQSTPGLGRTVAGYRLSRFERQFPEKFENFDITGILQGIPEDKHRAIQNLLNGTAGDATEAEVADAMRAAGFKIETNHSSTAVGKLDQAAERGRIYDAATPEGVENLLSLFWRPRPTGSGTAIEVKSGGSMPDRSQVLNDSVINKGQFSPTDRQFPMNEVKYLRVRIDQVDPQHLQTALNSRLSKTVERGRLSRAEAEAIRDRVLGYRSQSSATNPIPLITVGALLSQVMPEEEG